MDHDNAPSSDASETANNDGQQNRAPGAEARIAELTRQMHENERRYQQQIAELTQRTQDTLLQALAPKPQPAQEEPAVEIDPEERKKFEAIYGKEIKTLKQKADQHDRFVQSQQMAGSVQHAALQGPPIYQHPAIVARAQQLAQSWTMGGKGGWVPQDALTHAYGMLMAEAQMAQLQQQQQNVPPGFAPNPYAPAPQPNPYAAPQPQQFNPYAPPNPFMAPPQNGPPRDERSGQFMAPQPLMFQSPPPPVSQRRAGVPDIDFDNASPEQLEKYAAALEKNGA